MFLETRKMTRKQFIERSLLGFGSAFILPSLLQSCMKDHDLPNPGGDNNYPPPTLGDYEISWSDAAKTALSTALGMVPEGGEVLSALVEVLWPSTGVDVWSQVKDQVEALIDQKIADQVYQQVSEDLSGLKNSMDDYKKALANSTPAVIGNQWLNTKNLFDTARPHFQSKGYELLLLPLFAQFGNLYLGLLRDGVAFGQNWGRTPADNTQDIADLQNAMLTFYQYTYGTYNTGLTNLANTTKTDYHNCEPFKTLNAYQRQMTQTVMDFANNWGYFDVTQYPQGVPAELLYLDREIYSDPYGSCDDSGNIVLPAVPASKFPTNITVWGYDRIDAVQLTYPANGGPGGVTTTPRMGDQLDPKNPSFGGQNYAPHGGSFNISPNNPIIGAFVNYGLFVWNGGYNGPLVAQLSFQYQDGTVTPYTGGTAGAAPNSIYSSGWLGYSTEALSSIHINGVNNKLQTADCVVFGFKYWPSPAATLQALRTVYITSPKERTAAELTGKILNPAAVPGNLITEELKAARKAYWDAFNARVKGPK